MAELTNTEEHGNLSLLGVWPKRAEQLKKRGITSIRDLIFFIPRDYKDYGLPGGPKEGMAAVRMKLTKVNRTVTAKGVPMLVAEGVSGEKKVSALWFHMDFLFEEVRSLAGQEVVVAGNFTYDAQWDNYTAMVPDVFCPAWPYGDCPVIFPVYRSLSGVPDAYIRSAMETAVADFVNYATGILPARLERELGLPSMAEAARMAHFPESMEEAALAQKRFRAEKLYFFAMRMRGDADIRKKSPYKTKKGGQELAGKILSSLPYALTEDQEGAYKDLSGQMKEGKAVHALVQGDVGCGKSILAFLLMAAAAGSGYQAALMAPTSVLAGQHYKDLSALMEPYGVRVEYVPPLTSLKKKEKEGVLSRIKSGEAQMVVGTHSLLSKEIAWKNLALVITDEEHKFGVEQREELLRRTSAGVHYVTMSATPIPRSLAGVVYGEATQACPIRSMPAGRKPVQTAVSANMAACFKFLHRELDAGRQAYAVCPQVEDGKTKGVVSVKELERLYSGEFGDENVAALTGRTPKKEAEKILAGFREGKVKILVATTVIEVGVNVPNASTILVHNAERFGLASLHQLRGRVGRGGGDAYCILVSRDKENPRLTAMVKAKDGFGIAEEDLRLRGAGNLFGTEQSGMNEYISLMLAYPEEYKDIRRLVRELPQP